MCVCEWLTEREMSEKKKRERKRGRKKKKDLWQKALVSILERGVIPLHFFSSASPLNALFFMFLPCFLLLPIKYFHFGDTELHKAPNFDVVSEIYAALKVKLHVSSFYCPSLLFPLSPVVLLWYIYIFFFLYSRGLCISGLAPGNRMLTCSQSSGFHTFSLFFMLLL